MLEKHGVKATLSANIFNGRHEYYRNICYTLFITSPVFALPIHAAIALFRLGITETSVLEVQR